MSGSTENRTSGAFEKDSGRNATFTWTTAQRMLPLVGHIVADILGRQRHLTQMHLEKDRLDRLRRTLAWPERSRRYQLEEEITDGEQALLQVLAELDGLAVVLLDREAGQIGFPTVVNGRQAYFSWKPGDEGLVCWHFAEESVRRPIPPAWTKGPEPRRRGSRNEPR
jgi:hypothetical protein